MRSKNDTNPKINTKPGWRWSRVVKYVFDLLPRHKEGNWKRLIGGACPEEGIIYLFGCGQIPAGIEDVTWADIIEHEHLHNLLYNHDVPLETHHQIIDRMEKLASIWPKQSGDYTIYTVFPDANGETKTPQEETTKRMNEECQPFTMVTVKNVEKHSGGCHQMNLEIYAQIVEKNPLNQIV